MKNTKCISIVLIYNIVDKIVFFLTNLAYHVSVVFMEEPDETWVADRMGAGEIVAFGGLFAVETQVVFYLLFFGLLWWCGDGFGHSFFFLVALATVGAFLDFIWFVFFPPGRPLGGFPVVAPIGLHLDFVECLFFIGNEQNIFSL